MGATTLVEGVATIADLDSFLGDLDGIAAETGCTVQAFDARYVMGREHLTRALELADRAVERGENVARDRGMEVMLYAAGTRQIDRALTIGASEGEPPVVVLVDGDEAETAAERVRDLLDPADTLGVEHADRERVRAFFDVGPEEERATAGDLADLVLERVALLDVEK